MQLLSKNAVQMHNRSNIFLNGCYTRAEKALQAIVFTTELLATSRNDSQNDIMRDLKNTEYPLRPPRRIMAESGLCRPSGPDGWSFVSAYY
jgi:hypothetical protein